MLVKEHNTRIMTKEEWKSTPSEYENPNFKGKRYAMFNEGGVSGLCSSYIVLSN